RTTSPYPARAHAKSPELARIRSAGRRAAPSPGGSGTSSSPGVGLPTAAAADASREGKSACSVLEAQLEEGQTILQRAPFARGARAELVAPGIADDGHAGELALIGKH